MKRTQLLNLLDSYNSVWPEEMVYKKQMIEFIQEHEHCFERSLAIGHITASCWLLNQDGSQALLMHHAKLNRWFQLGGHCDGESDVLAVAVKEAQEESGIQSIEPISDKIFDIDIHLIPANTKEAAHYHYDVRFLLHAKSDELIIQNRESKELRWISDSLPTNELSVVRMFNKWKSGISF